MSNVEKNSVSCHSIAYMLLLQRNNGTWQGWVGLERTILSPCSFITLKSNPIHQKDIRSFHSRVISTSLNHQFIHLSTTVVLLKGMFGCSLTNIELKINWFMIWHIYIKVNWTIILRLCSISQWVRQNQISRWYQTHTKCTFDIIVSMSKTR
jgi:hypothetical protein